MGQDERGTHAIPLFGKSDAAFEKCASSGLLPDVVRYIESLRPSPTSQYVLVNAMGAGEWYGSNINGDHFPEASLIHLPDNWTGVPAIDKGVSTNWSYGFPTFYNAYPYAHHRNKDTSRAFGTVELATWNPNMKRVELVVKVDHDKCLQYGGVGVWDKLRIGEYPDVSMGTKVPYDTCSICLDWDLYREAQARPGPTNVPPGQKILAFHKQKKAKDGVGIRGLSITRNDYCFPPGVPILLADGTWKPIQDVCVGDTVISHTGAAREVVELLPSQRQDTLVRLHAWGMLPIPSTGNHPFLSTSPKDKLGRANWLEQHVPDWVAAEDIQEGDLVFCPITTIGEPDQPELFGKLLGLYIAEGNLLYSKGVAWPKAVQFTFNATERHLVDFVLEQAEQFDSEATHRILEYKDRSALSLFINSKTLAAWLLSLGGSGSLHKRLSPAIWGMGKTFCRELLHGWSLGDGSRTNQNLRVVTSSEDLARQGQLLAASLGILVGLSQIERTSNYCHQIVWYLAFSGDAATAVEWGRPQVEVAQQSKLFLWNNYLVSSIRKVDISERDGSWYNFEVEQDHSYVAGGYAVHNCVHAKTQMSKIFPDGRKVWVYNDYPRFFDISFVFIGADKTAKVMLFVYRNGSIHSIKPSAEVAENLGITEAKLEGKEKSASVSDELLKAAFGKLAKPKSAEIDKTVVPSQFAGKAVPLLTRAESDIPREVLDGLGALPLASVLSTLTGMGVLLRPKEYQRITLIQIGRGKLADDLDAAGEVFEKSDHIEPADLDKSKFSSGLAALMLPWLAERSALGPVIEKRIVISREGLPFKYAQAPSHSTQLLAKLAASYNGYRQGVMELVAHAQDLLGEGTRYCEFRKLASAPVSQIFTPLSVAYLQTAFMDEFGVLQNGVVKLSTGASRRGEGFPLEEHVAN